MAYLNSAPEAPTAIDPTAPRTGYGQGQRNLLENPAWVDWNTQQNKYKQDIATLEGAPGWESQLAYTKQLLQQGWAQEPERYIKTELGQDVAAVKDQGAAATGQLTTDASQIRQAGQTAYDSGRANSTTLKQEGLAVQGRQAPQISATPGARTEQQAAGASAAGFSAPQGAAQNTSNTSNDAAAIVRNTANDYAQNIAGFRPGSAGAADIRNAGVQGSDQLSRFRAATGGIQSLNKFAQGPAGPSAAAAQLRMQADRDRRAALSLARSARGGPAAVALALRRAQAEGAATAAETRGQASVLRATEAATERGQNLSALQSAGGLEQQASQTNLGALTGAAQTNLQGQTAATAAELQGSAQTLQAGTAAGQLALEGASNAGQLQTQGAIAAGNQALGASGQNLQAIQIRGDIANTVRAMDIDEAKAQLGADLQTMGMNDEQTRFFTGLGEQARQDAEHAKADALARGLSADQASAQIGLQYANQAWNMLTADQQAQLQQLAIERGVTTANNQNSAQQRQQDLQFLGTLLLAGGAAASDRRVKKAVSRLRSIASDLRQTPGYEWSYKDGKKHGQGRYTGAMAQDLERTRTFRSAVKNVGGTKIIDGTRLAMSQQSALHDLQKQIDRLGKLVKKPKGDKTPDKRAS
jgi:hypothetical protein